jgi:hypothetical protein
MLHEFLSFCTSQMWRRKKIVSLSVQGFGYSEYILIDYCGFHYTFTNLLVSDLYRQNNYEEFLDSHDDFRIESHAIHKR